MKERRQQVLLELVRKVPLASQLEIRDRLARLGHPATQSTISRDLEELGLVRVRDRDGHLRYAPPAEAAATGALPRLRALLAEFAIRVEPSGNLVVVTTPPGAANAVAEALDRAEVPGILGTVAGDNTILVICRARAKGSAVAARLRDLGGLS